MIYFLMLFFVWWTAFKLCGLYYNLRYSLGARAFPGTDGALRLLYATLATVFFHNVW